MTPKEKAKELFDKFYPYVMMDGYYYEATKEGDIQNAKECALIAVDEIISNMPYGFYSGIIPAYKGTDLDYWQEVKQEIEKK